MKQAIFLDFYGTVVFEDGEVISKIEQIIFDTGVAGSTKEIGSFWWKEFFNTFIESYGDKFRTQREIEYESLEKTIAHFRSTADAKTLSDEMFAYWQKPPIFEEAKQFLEESSVPIYIVSNIDTQDIMEAMKYHGLTVAGVFTSEDARSYKPRKELFEYALKKSGHMPEQVVHIGDSLSSDVKGASDMGIDTIWVNRSGREVPEGVCAVSNLLEVFDTSLWRICPDDFCL